MNYFREIFKKWALCRNFELKVAEIHKQGLINCPIYLSVGHEIVASTVATAYANRGFSIFPQHRCHSWYVAFGGDLSKLFLELLGSPLGCTGGRGGSASIHDKSIPLFGHSGLLGDQVPIAVGYAHAINKPTIVVLGDAAAEEDYVLGALGFAVSRKVPVLFICEDNDLSILTKKSVRRSWKITDVAGGFGIQHNTFRDYHIKTLYMKLIEKEKELPCFINIEVNRHLWHAGSGRDEEFDDEVCGYFMQEFKDFNDVYEEAKQKVENAWQLSLKLLESTRENI